MSAVDLLALGSGTQTRQGKGESEYAQDHCCRDPAPNITAAPTIQQNAAHRLQNVGNRIKLRRDFDPAAQQRDRHKSRRQER